MWTEDGVQGFRHIISPTLANLQENWKDPATPVSFSVLIQATNAALTSAAKQTNKFKDLSKERNPRKEHISPEVNIAAREKKAAHKHWLVLSENTTSSETELLTAKLQFTDARKKHRRLWRRHQAHAATQADALLHDLLTSDPKAAHSELRRHKSSSETKISELKVGDQVFLGEEVADGFFQNMKQLKTINSDIKTCSDCEHFKFDYNLIVELSKAGDPIPLLSLVDTEKLLYSLKPNVCDHYNISSLHYLHAGPAGIRHFQLLINSAIRNIENTTCEEFNTAHAYIHYKGHQKKKDLASSYRTISTCPFLAKAMDYYVRQLSSSDWSEAQAETQYLGANLSHELGALLLTETISHSISNDLPVFCLFLDARSAFDLTIREITIRKLHLVGTTGQRLMYIDNRLKHRETFMEWDKKVLGPIKDELGFEQGGISSSDFYITYNNEQLQNAQESGLGASIGNEEIAAIGQADDVVLLSHDIRYLANLLELTMDYCKKHHVTLAPEKTKLMAFSGSKLTSVVEYHQLISNLKINNTTIEFVTSTEHVGVIRSTVGNLPHVQNRITSHNKSLYAVLPAGLARNRFANPAASLRVEAVHALPVLLSGVASLVLSGEDTKILHLHHKNTLQSIQKLHQKTPEPFIMFMAGSPGATAHLHMRILGLFGMITRLPTNILHNIALQKLLTEPDSSSSWFVNVRHLCVQYDLPSPIILLFQPLTKERYKSLTKSKVISFWESKYREESASKPSLLYFKPEYHSLLKPHPLWTTCDNNSFEVNKSVVVARLLSGRYYSDWHCRHWSQDNPSGSCMLCPDESLPGTTEHLLVSCNALKEKRETLKVYIKHRTEDNPDLAAVVEKEMSNNNTHTQIVQFLLDPSVVPSVRSAVQLKKFTLPDVFAITRTYVYAMHRKRLQISGRFNVL